MLGQRGFFAHFKRRSANLSRQCEVFEIEYLGRTYLTMYLYRKCQEEKRVSQELLERHWSVFTSDVCSIYLTNKHCIGFDRQMIDIHLNMIVSYRPVFFNFNRSQ